MSRKCEFTGKKTTTGRTYATGGMAKYLGGVGIKTHGKSKRQFRPNLQPARVTMPDGSVKKTRVSAKALKSGLVAKAPKRKHVYRAGQQSS